MNEDKDNPLMFLKDYLEAVIKEQERERQRVALEIIERVKINFEEFFDFISIIKGTGKEPLIKEYEDFFYRQWVENVSLMHKKILEMALDDGNEDAIELLDYIKGMGVKFKALTESKLCVSTSFPVNCEECYFLKVCPLV